MKYTIVFVIAALGLSLAFFSCKSKKAGSQSDNVPSDIPESYSEQRESASTVDVERLTKKPWKQIRMKDSYDNIWKDTAEGQAKTFTFLADGKFTVEQPENPKHEGQYRMVGEKGIAINHSGNRAELQYQVEYLEKEKLVLAMQGRHGAVYYVFEPVK